MEQQDNAIKNLILNAITNYLNKKKDDKINYHVLQEIFPEERRIRSIIGGLETSFGQTVWEPLAKMLAKKNGYRVHEKTDFKRPEKMPKEIQNIIDKWNSKRINSKNYISLNGYVNEVREAVKALNIDYNKVEYVKLIKGQGIDVWIEKNGVEYITDIKTTQINAGDGNKFNQHILNWYAYRLFKNPDVELRVFISIPFNPFNVPWKDKQGGRAKPLIVDEDIIIANEFWTLISGESDEYEKIIKAFKELKDEGLIEKYREVIYGKKLK